MRNFNLAKRAKYIQENYPNLQIVRYSYFWLHQIEYTNWIHQIEYTNKIVAENLLLAKTIFIGVVLWELGLGLGRNFEGLGDKKSAIL